MTFFLDTCVLRTDKAIADETNWIEVAARTERRALPSLIDVHHRRRREAVEPG